MTLEIEYEETAQLKEMRVGEIARHTKIEKRLDWWNRTEVAIREQNIISWKNCRSAAAQQTASQLTVTT
jgi:hypothetical protein